MVWMVSEHAGTAELTFRDSAVAFPKNYVCDKQRVMCVPKERWTSKSGRLDACPGDWIDCPAQASGLQRSISCTEATDRPRLL